MKLKERMLAELSKTYEPSTLIEKRFGRYDIAFKTDEVGRPVLLFMGSKDENGHIRGDRYARRLKFNDAGEVLKDHWEHKGKATP